MYHNDNLSINGIFNSNINQFLLLADGIYPFDRKFNICNDGTTTNQIFFIVRRDQEEFENICVMLESLKCDL